MILYFESKINTVLKNEKLNIYLIFEKRPVKKPTNKKKCLIVEK